MPVQLAQQSEVALGPSAAEPISTCHDAFTDLARLFFRESGLELASDKFIHQRRRGWERNDPGDAGERGLQMKKKTRIHTHVLMSCCVHACNQIQMRKLSGSAVQAASELQVGTSSSKR